ncbi:hypothetical protein CTI12_AA016620 (mitochondrion) [Artemisia annua]|uniref:Uncharacterized protein n=1 Tax=Artemisia annua TaxID=35608 RepID=A0A2U1QA11_ARTAN|nr:hypothetical protein CTI12_AA016620 [Artemisia annua]
MWGFAPTIAVLESKYGFQPLNESKVLAVNYWNMLLVNVIYSGGVIGMLLCHLILLNTDEKSVWCWISSVQVGVKYAQFSMVLVFYVVMVTVLYLRAKVALVVGDDVIRNWMEINFDDMRDLL